MKASLANSTMSFISSRLGEPGLKNTLAAFDSKELTGKRLLPSDWVLEQTYHDLLVAAGQCLGATPGAGKPKEFFFEMGRFLASDGINKYYKALIHMFDTNFMLTKSPHLWGVVHSHGSVKVEPIGKTGVYIYITDYPAPCKEFCYMMRGYIWAVGELTKADVISLEELECVTEGAKCCKFMGKWRPSSTQHGS